MSETSLFYGIKSSVAFHRKWKTFLRRKIHFVPNWLIILLLERGSSKACFLILACCLHCWGNFGFFISFLTQRKKLYNTVCHNDFITLVTGLLSWKQMNRAPKTWYHQWFKSDEYYERQSQEKKILSLSFVSFSRQLSISFFHWNGYNSFKRIKRHFRDVIKLLAHQHQLWRAREFSFFHSYLPAESTKLYIYEMWNCANTYFFVAHCWNLLQQTAYQFCSPLPSQSV